MITDQHGKGAIRNPNLKPEHILSVEALALIPDFTKPTGLTEPPDEDQGTSGSCTSQANGYYIWQFIKDSISRNDTYSFTFLPGGGAYLNSPGQFILDNGLLLRGTKYPEPNPETEANMEHIILAKDAQGRSKAYSFEIKNISVDINTVASILEQYKGCIIGVDGNNPNWQNPIDPTYDGHAVWGHALYIYDRAIRNGKNTLKAKSSWCNTVKDHFINSDYFTNGGVFEALVYVNFKEISMSQIKVVLGSDGHTVYKCEPIVDMTELNDMASVEGFTVPNPIPSASTL